MKRHYYWAVFGVMLIHTSVLSQSSSWELVAPIPPRKAAYSCVTIGNTAYFWCGNNIVFSSSDGGGTFRVSSYGPVRDVALGCCNNQGIAFADTLVGYITDIAHGEFRTTNGGGSWEQQNPFSVESVIFGTNRIGWKFADGGILKTTDAGVTWNSVLAPVGYGGIFGKAFALNQDSVWLAKSYYAGRPLEGSIWFSSDGGETWSQQPEAPTSDSTQSVVYSDLRFTSWGLGVAIGTLQFQAGAKASFAARTTDFGLHWTTATFIEESPKVVIEIQDSIWIILGGGSSPYMRRSVDSAQSWTYRTNIFPTQYYQFFGSATYIPGFNTMLASTVNGVYRSTDFGLTFSRQTGPYDIIIDDLALDREPNPLDGQLVMATSFDGKYLNTTDGGNSWKIGQIPGISYSSPKVVISNGNIFIPSHQIQKSSDRGDSWIRLGTPASSGVFSFDALDENNLLFQSYQTMWHSVDGGLLWNKTPYPASSYLWVSQLTQPGTIVAGGAYYDTSGTRGIFYSSSDWGLNWRIVDTPQEIKRLTMVTRTTGYAISDYEMYKTTDGGSTWNTILSSQNYFTSFRDFFFEDSVNGTLRVSFEFWETTNGGATWTTKEYVLPLYMVSEFARTNDGSVLAVGEGMLWKLAAEVVPPITSGEDTTLSDDSRVDLSMGSFPNPFNSFTTIRFTLPEDGHVTLKVYDLLGRVVGELTNETMRVGKHQATFDAAKLPSGVYFYKLDFGGKSISKKFVLTK